MESYNDVARVRASCSVISLFLIALVALAGCGDSAKEHPRSDRTSASTGARKTTRSMTSYFPLAVGNSWTYKRTVNEAPMYSWEAKVLEDWDGSGDEGNTILYIGVEPSIETRVETYTVAQKSGEGFEVAGVVESKEEKAQGFEPYELMELEKLVWRINKWDGQPVVVEQREGDHLGNRVRSWRVVGALKTDGGFKIGVNPETGACRQKVMGTRGPELTVPAATFRDTIKNTFEFVGGADFQDVKIERFFAKDVGLVKEVQYDSKGEVTYTLELQSFKVK